MVALARLREQWASLDNPAGAIAAMDQIKQPNAISYELLVARANTAAAIKDRIQLVTDTLSAVVQ